MKRPTVIDLFAGAGGLSSSLEATGWQSLAAIDIDKFAIESLQLNQARGRLRSAAIIKADVQELSGRDILPQGIKLDLLAGGPPCQPFSSAGSMKALEDPRGRLFHEFVRLADELKPRFVLFENVAGLVTAKSPEGQVGGVLRRVQDEFEAIGYACRFSLLNAADFGAPQRRVRLYMVASRQHELPVFPEPTHARSPAVGTASWVTLGDFLSTQPQPDPVDVVRPSAKRLVELAGVPPGKGLRSGGIVEANRPSGHWGYRQDCFVADWAMPSRTVRAASTPDWLRFRDNDLRRLTWRECAALQGFDSDWEFAGPAGARFRQIGNAVQGHIGRALGAALFEAASLSRKARPLSVEWPDAFYKRVRYTQMEEVTNGAVRRASRKQLNETAKALV